MGATHDLDDYDDDTKEVGEQYFRMRVADATAEVAILKAARFRARTNADKHKETRARRAKLWPLSNGKTQVGYFKTGVNRGTNLVRCGTYALHSGVGTNDVSGEPLKSEMVMAARKLELE